MVNKALSEPVPDLLCLLEVTVAGQHQLRKETKILRPNDRYTYLSRSLTIHNFGGRVGSLQAIYHPRHVSNGTINTGQLYD